MLNWCAIMVQNVHWLMGTHTPKTSAIQFRGLDLNMFSYSFAITYIHICTPQSRLSHDNVEGSSCLPSFKALQLPTLRSAFCSEYKRVRSTVAGTQHNTIDTNSGTIFVMRRLATFAPHLIDVRALLPWSLVLLCIRLRPKAM